MIDSRSNPAAAERPGIPGDRLIVAIEASTDRIIAAQKRAIWSMSFGAVLVVAVAMTVLVLVSRS